MQEEGAGTDAKMQLYSGRAVNAVQRTEPLSEFARLCALLVPLCMPRAVEEVLYGPAAVTLATAPQVRSQGLGLPRRVLDYEPSPVSARPRLLTLAPLRPCVEEDSGNFWLPS